MRNELKTYIFTKPVIIFFGTIAIIFNGLSEIWLIILFLISIGLNISFYKKEKLLNNLSFLGLILIYSTFFLNIFVLIVNNVSSSIVNYGDMIFGFFSMIIVTGVMTIDYFWSTNLFGLKEVRISKEQLTSHLATEKKRPESKDKSKRLMKGLAKTVGKVAVDAASDHLSEIAGEFVGDQLKELTGDENIARFAGKLAEKGIEKLSSYAVDSISEKISDRNGANELTEFTSTATYSQPSQINHEIRLLGIIKTKKIVKIEYIENFLNLPKNQIIGQIYDLIGKGVIEGEFNQDDTEFKLIR